MQNHTDSERTCSIKQFIVHYIFQKIVRNSSTISKELTLTSNMRLLWADWQHLPDEEYKIRDELEDQRLDELKT